MLLAGLAEQGLDEVSAVLAPCQHRLFDLGGELAMPSYQALNLTEVERLEAAIDVWNEELGPLKNFILPSGSALVAQAHVCRSPGAQCGAAVPAAECAGAVGGGWVGVYQPAFGFAVRGRADYWAAAGGGGGFVAAC
ncbi:ATP--cobalamin adenosyltransferase [Pseudomonas putida S11]|nr:ATP--cobalamin adenosyltransferase [Pseudomonas putida S11]